MDHKSLLCNSLFRKHDRKGVARKRTNFSSEPMTSTIAGTEHHSSRMAVDGVPEIIRPGFTSTPTFTSVGGYRATYEHTAVPNNNDLYALMELTKNSGIKEVHVDENGVATSKFVIYSKIIKGLINRSTILE